MQSPLDYVYFEERCSACGERYPVTLHGIHLRQHLEDQWQTARPCEACDSGQERLVGGVPRAELDALVQAWERMARALEAHGLPYRVGVPTGTQVAPHRAAAAAKEAGHAGH
jgi:hypothetical protein